jgi:hypothetical protein
MLVENLWEGETYFNCTVGIVCVRLELKQRAIRVPGRNVRRRVARQRSDVVVGEIISKVEY